MTVGIMQPYLFPYIGYFQLINVVDRFVLLDDVNYINKGWINRNVIKDGKYTIPLKGASQNKEIREIEIVPEGLEIFFRRLKHNYGKSGRFNDVMRLLDWNPLLSNLSDYAYASLSAICQYLDIKTDIIRTSSVFGHELRGQDRIIDICLQLGADRYINPAGGIDLYDPARFRSHGIELKFLNCGFSDKKSIVDDLFMIEKHTLKDFVKYYFLTDGS